MNTIICFFEIISSLLFSSFILINYRTYILPVVGWWAYNSPYIFDSLSFLINGESEFSSKTHFCILLFNISLCITMFLVQSFSSKSLNTKEYESNEKNFYHKIKIKRFRKTILIAGIILFILNIFANGIQDLFVTPSLTIREEYTRPFIGQLIQTFLWTFITINLIYSVRIKWKLGVIIFGIFLFIDFIGGDRTYPLLFGTSLLFIYSSILNNQIKKILSLKLNLIKLFIFFSFGLITFCAAIFGKLIYTITGLTFINLVSGRNEWDFTDQLIYRFNPFLALRDSESFHIAGILDKTINADLHVEFHKIIDTFVTIVPFHSYIFNTDSRWYPWLIKDKFFPDWGELSSPASSFIGHFYSFGGYIGILFLGIILPIIWEFLTRMIRRIKDYYLSSSILLIYSYWTFYVYRNSIDVMVAHTKKTIIVSLIGFVFCYLFCKIRLRIQSNSLY